MNIFRMYKNRKRILGMNERNLKYIRPYNLKSAVEIADDKLKSKKILEANNVPTPPLIATIKDREALRKFDWESLPKSFVMKPVHGLEGAGIEIFYNRDKEGNWIKGDGSKVTPNALKLMALDILDGKYSLHNQKDSVFFEERVKMHKAFKYYAYKGAPDVRIIVFNNIPIMSYVRLPTKESKGKGNLAQGAIGAAIDLVTGTTTTAIIGKKQPIETIPGTHLSVRGLKIPYWNQLLKTAIRSQRATDLGFAAIDFLIDRERGPVVIEMNARPGLSIQISNRDGLRWRLKKAAGIKVTSTAKGLRVAKDMFGGQTEQEIEKVSGKQVVSHIEAVEVVTTKSSKVSTLALIDTSRRTTTIDAKLAKRAGIIDEDTEIEDPIISDITFNLAGTTVTSDCRVVPKPIKGYKLLIGRKDLGNFLVDIRRVATGKSGRQKETLLTAQPYTDPVKIDEQLSEISSDMGIAKIMRPVNLVQERKKFRKEKNYNPILFYNPIQIDTDKILDRLKLLRPDTSTEIGQLFEQKINEYKKKLYLIEAIGDDENFPRRSINMYDEPDEGVFNEALKVVKETATLKEKNKDRGKKLTQSEVEKIIKEDLEANNIEATIEYTGKEGPKTASVTRTGVIKINKNYQFTKEKLLGTLAHEVEVHLKRTAAGRNKKYKIFQYGTAGYIEIEEGLAILNKARKLNSKQPIRNAALMYISAYYNHKHSFIDTYKFMKEIGIDEKNAFKFTYRTKKGITNTKNNGAYMKDALYFTGYLKVKDLSDEEIDALLENGKTHELIEIEES